MQVNRPENLKNLYEMDTCDESEHRYFNCENIETQDIHSLGTLLDKNKLTTKKNLVIGSNINAVEDDLSRDCYDRETKFVNRLSSGFIAKGN